MPAPEVEEKQLKQQVNREIRDMMSTLTRRLAHLQKKPTEGGSASNIHEHDHEDDDDHGGFGIITMAGSNEGATMRGDMNTDGHKSNMKENNEALTSYLNSNFQGVNNSIMVGGSYSASDPGINLDVEDRYEDDLVNRYVKKGKKKVFPGSSKSS